MAGGGRVQSRDRKGRRRRVRSRAAIACILVAAALVLALGGPLPAASANHLTHFMFMGDIWAWNGASGGATSLVHGANGHPIGSPSSATQASGFAYVESSLGDSKVVFMDGLLQPGKNPWHEFPQASSPDVAPDGSKVVFDYWNMSGNALRVYDAFSDSITLALPGAFAGTWSPDGRYLAYNRHPENHPLNDGFYIFDTQTHVETKVSVTYAGESGSDSNAWAPRWSPDGQWFVVTKYVNSTGRIEIVKVQRNGTGATKVYDVTPYDISDVRWTSWPGGGQGLFVETVPGGGSESTISAVATPEFGAPYLIARLRRSSFGFGASLVPDSPFGDVGTDHPYYQAIAMMRLAGIVSGYSDGAFGPADPVRRAQFAKMIVGALRLSVNEGLTSPFTDLGPDKLGDLYPNEYVAAAWKAGITKGTTATTFAPWNYISRAQLVTMVVRAAKEKVPGGLPDPPMAWTGVVPSSDPTHGANLRLAEYSGLLVGINLNGWNVATPATRGEVAQILYRLMRAIGPDTGDVGLL